MAGVDYNQKYFVKQVTANDVFFERFGTEPRWEGRSVLDVGSGHGALSIRAAQHGARRVVGIDLATGRVQFATEMLANDFPELVGRVEFRAADVASLDERFDLIVSKDTFEHVADLPALLHVLHDRLEPDGELWVGFSPLYYSPFGSHGRTGTRVPWAHTLPWPLVRRLASRGKGRPVQSLRDIGLNGLTPAEFRSAAAEAGLAFKSLRYNQGARGRLLDALRAVRAVPGLEKYATVSIYAILTITS